MNNRMYVTLIFGLLLGSTIPACGDDWPQWRGPKRDGIWRETGIVETLPKDLKIRWRAPIGGGYAGPAVSNGKVYVADRQLDKGISNPSNPFDKKVLSGKERLLCLKESDGTVLWQYEYPCSYRVSYASGPRATPTVDGDLVFLQGTMGDFTCLNANTGELVWKKDFVKEYKTIVNQWGLSSAPLVYGDQVIAVVGGKSDAGLVSFDKRTGKEVWRALEFEDMGYCTPEIIEAGGEQQLIFWSTVAIHSVNPKTGKLFWEQDFPVKAGMSISSPIFDGENLFVTGFYCGPLMMKLAKDSPTAKLAWKGKGTGEQPKQTDGLHAVMCTPFFEGGHIYGVCSYGELRCLNPSDGTRVWSTNEATGTTRWCNAFIVRNEDRCILFNEHGDLITAKLSPKGYEETSRASLIEADNRDARMGRGDRLVVWTHPAFANKCVFARNDHEIVCADLSAK